MADNILTVAAALGGTIQSFEQHSGTEETRGNCMVHAARWMRAKQKQGDFIKKYGTHSVGHRAFTVPQAQFKEKRGYVEQYLGMPPHNGQIYVKLERLGPSKDDEVKASAIRSTIKPPDSTPTAADANLVRFVEKGGRGLRGADKPKILFRKGVQSKNIPFDASWAEELLKYFSAPGYYFAGMYGDGGHAIAFLVTEAEFWYFDPAVGELKLERGMVETWLNHGDVKKYFTSRSFISVTNYISEA